MRPLKVALLVKNTPSTFRRDDRNMGWWSYPVDEFTWKHFTHGDTPLDLHSFSDYDFIYHEDGGNWCEYKRPGPPVVYMSIDDTLSEQHYHARLTQAKRADLVLIDHGALARFKGTCKRVRRFNYCVNDRVYHPHEPRRLDVVYHCSGGGANNNPGSVERATLRALLGAYCENQRLSYKSGGVGLDEYAANMGAAKVVVNWPRTVTNRPHRVFDAMASGAALLTGVIPLVDGDGVVSGTHYLAFGDFEEVYHLLDGLICEGKWQDYAAAGFDLVMKRHIWKVRAKELRQILNEELGL